MLEQIQKRFKSLSDEEIKNEFEELMGISKKTKKEIIKFIEY